jgi:hypothetical protein
MKKLQAILKYLNYKGYHPLSAYLNKTNQCVLFIDMDTLISGEIGATLDKHFCVSVYVIYYPPRYFKWLSEEVEEGMLIESYSFIKDKESVDAET